MAAPSKSLCTLLVRNLPPDAKESKLEELFGDIGPIKRCFIVRDKTQQSMCKGVAYVTYASTADAEAAVERSRQRSLKWGDRVLAVKAAAPKATRGEPVSKDTAPKKRIFTKEEKAARKKRKPRLIVRNLSFKATEKTLRDCFSRYGNVVEVSIPKKSDGKCRGFAFVQFDETKSAIKAINGLNATEVLGRPIAVDFSLPKATYQQTTISSPGATTDTPDKGGGSAFQHRESEEMSDDDAESHSPGASASEEDSEHGCSDIDEDSGDDSECSADVEPDRRPKGDTKNTLFIRNVSFDSQQEGLETLMKQFGPCRYCLLCTDVDTGRSRGTAFVRFVQDSSVDACLEAAASSAGIMLDGRRLDVVRALSRGELEEKQKEKKKEKKDRRNLYLAREGLVRPGTEAAQGVSPQDMAKRAKLQARKRKLLANLHYFVSPTRLSVHNLPPSVDDRKLRALFLENAPHGARITEARVMRNLKSPTAESYGYGFVTFTKHEDALAALRELNNNPGTFGPKKRPIIEFCLENKAALVAKERRLQRSKQKLKELHESQVEEQRPADIPMEKKTAFMGAAANRKMKGLPTHSGPKVRTKKGRAGKQNLQLKNKKGKRKLKQKQKTFVKNPRTEKDSFSTMLDKHKKVHSKQSKQTPTMHKTKWFQNQ
ncbi:RNA-binding protein 28 isoform X1 [Dermacentor albipictus]|uniref:RNA-binding protein 28 isoform X1 n=2 Tax=Dermacentor albipictus TaxID=60249 RepID=UPI0031FD16B5